MSSGGARYGALETLVDDTSGMTVEPTVLLLNALVESLPSEEMTRHVAPGPAMHGLHTHPADDATAPRSIEASETTARRRTRAEVGMRVSK